MSKIRMLFMDVDGTLTNGEIYISEQGEIMKAFHVRDGYIITKLPDYNIIPVIITGRKSKIVEIRCKEIGINEIYQGIENKKQKAEHIIKKYGLSWSETAYIGDDLPDAETMSCCAVSGCPADAVDKIKETAVYVCKADGGKGAVREFIDKIILI